MHYTVEQIAELAGTHMSDLNPDIEMDGVWPVVDPDGYLTGSVTDCDDNRVWALVDCRGNLLYANGNTCAILAADFRM